MYPFHKLVSQESTQLSEYVLDMNTAKQHGFVSKAPSPSQIALTRVHTAQRAKIGTPYLRLQEKTTLPNQFVFLISLHFFARIVCVGMIWRSLPN